ncbi:MAG: T9SS type A sorting domain-containing protein [Saprospiraceae bacterium]
MLPIELTNFIAQEKEVHAVQINWSTASETNNAHFSIEKSPDGHAFRGIGQVPGHGTSYATNHYQFVDESPFPGLNYYRLKQVDFDGQYSYSPIVSVDFDGGRTSAVYPTLAKEVVYVSLPGDRNRSTGLFLFDQTGQLVGTQEVSGEAVLAEFPLAGLPPGMYFMKIQTAGVVETHRVVKME